MENEINEFIKKWCGDNTAHLLDTDENDGQRLRDSIGLLIDKEKERIARDIGSIIQEDIDYYGVHDIPEYAGVLEENLEKINKRYNIK